MQCLVSEVGLPDIPDIKGQLEVMSTTVNCRFLDRDRCLVWYEAFLLELKLPIC